MSTKTGLILHFPIPESKTPGDFFSKTHIKSHYFMVPFVSVFNNNITALGSAGYTKHFTHIVCNRLSSHKVEIMIFLSILYMWSSGTKSFASELSHASPT